MIRYPTLNISKLSQLLLLSILCTHQKVGGVQSFASLHHHSSTRGHRSIKFRDVWDQDSPNPLTPSQFHRRVPSLRGGNSNYINDEDNDVQEEVVFSETSLDSISGDSSFVIQEHETQHGYQELSLNEALEELADNELQQPLQLRMLSTVPSQTTESAYQRIWPCGDALDVKLIKIALPCIANFAINPLVGAVDLFWINRMGNTLAVAGQAAANQIFSSAFWLTSFLPSVTATLVAKEFAKGSEEGVQDSICQALLIGFFVASCGSWLVLSR